MSKGEKMQQIGSCEHGAGGWRDTVIRVITDVMKFVNITWNAFSMFIVDPLTFLKSIPQWPNFLPADPTSWRFQDLPVLPWGNVFS